MLESAKAVIKNILFGPLDIVLILSFLFHLIISENISPIIVMYLPISFVVQELSIESRSSLTCGTVLELIEYRPKDLIESAENLNIIKKYILFIYFFLLIIFNSQWKISYILNN